MTVLNDKLIRQISRQKKEPDWMLELRLKGLEAFNRLPLPDWGPDLSGLDFNQINYYSEPESLSQRRWGQVPEKIRRVYERLGIPEAERRFLAGSAAQWDSSIVYQHLKQKLDRQGVIFCAMDEAVQKFPEPVRKHFMTKCVTIANNKFSALHAACWSGGSFVYVPKGVKVSEPLQGYFWLNLKQGGQFEHTLIIAEENSNVHYIEGCSAPVYTKDSLHAGVVEIYVAKGAKVRYSTVQNWSKNVYNLATKRAIIEENGLMEWVSGSLGSKITMVYPASVLVGSGARAEHLSLSMAGKNQELDTGGKAIHLAPNTASNMISKSISKAGGIASYRGLVTILKGAKGAKASVSCESLLLDDKSQAKTYPQMEIKENEVTAVHEAKTGRIAEEELIYLMSRGLSEIEAMGMIINGFIEPVVKTLPLEYAVELNRLVELEMEGAVG